MDECIFEGVDPVPTNIPCYVGDSLPMTSTGTAEIPAPFNDEEWMESYTLVQILIVAFIAVFWGGNTIFRKYS